MIQETIGYAEGGKLTHVQSSSLELAAAKAGITDSVSLSVIECCERLTVTQLDTLCHFLLRHRRVRDETDLVGEPFLCGSPERGHRNTKPDRWRTRPNGELCCSFCGSANPEVLLAVLIEAGDPEMSTRIEQATGKPHKLYLHRESVPNASVGALHFYTWHLPPPETELAGDIRVAWGGATLWARMKFMAAAERALAQ